MASARQVFWVRAFWVVLCAGAFPAVCANGWQFHPGSTPPSQSDRGKGDFVYHERLMRGMPIPRVNKPAQAHQRKSNEVSCTVLKWTKIPVSTLDLACPAKGVTSLIRLYFHMSWEIPEGVPRVAEDVVADPDTPAKLRLPIKDRMGNPAAAVRLPVRHNGQGKVLEKWVTFDSVGVTVGAD